MMEYAQYQPPVQAQHGHSHGPIQGGYLFLVKIQTQEPPLLSPSKPIHHDQALTILSSQPIQAGQQQNMNNRPVYPVPQAGMHYGSDSRFFGQGYPYTLFADGS